MKDFGTDSFLMNGANVFDLPTQEWLFLITIQGEIHFQLNEKKFQSIKDFLDYEINICTEIKGTKNHTINSLILKYLEINLNNLETCRNTIENLYNYLNIWFLKLYTEVNTNCNTNFSTLLMNELYVEHYDDFRISYNNSLVDTDENDFLNFELDKYNAILKELDKPVYKRLIFGEIDDQDGSFKSRYKFTIDKRVKFLNAKKIAINENDALEQNQVIKNHLKNDNLMQTVGYHSKPIDFDPEDDWEMQKRKCDIHNQSIYRRYEENYLNGRKQLSELVSKMLSIASQRTNNREIDLLSRQFNQIQSVFSNALNFEIDKGCEIEGVINTNIDSIFQKLREFQRKSINDIDIHLRTLNGIKSRFNNELKISTNAVFNDNEGQNIISEAHNQIEATFKLITFTNEQIVEKLYDGLKNLFPSKEEDLLKALNGEKLSHKITFPNNQNKFVEVFQRAKYNGLILNAPGEIKNWIITNFNYAKKNKDSRIITDFNANTVLDILVKGRGEPPKNERICQGDWLPYKSHTLRKTETDNEKQ